VTPAVFAVTLSVAGVGPVATPAPVSVALQVIVALALVQPAALGAGERAALKFGEALAVTVCTPSPTPATSGNVHDDLAVLDVWRVV
jgi:hypothetical protein